MQSNALYFIHAALECAGWEDEDVKRLQDLIKSAEEAASEEDVKYPSDTPNVEAMYGHGKEYANSAGVELPQDQDFDYND